ncbi:MAG TPA: AmmeMemoRadiSam system protein A [Vicinamibacterales bacterium]|nr:AmmeMemoRadiSam system protein A [Vicinamibacterales bacterium]
MALLDDAAKKSLLQRARHVIAKAIGVTPAADPIPTPQLPIPGELRAGAFVTLRVRGNLRGCIGYPEPELLLVEVIDRCAVSAALADPRFPPLSADEWDEIDLELSILGPIEPAHDIRDVVIGRDGLIVEFGRRRGLLLPQVAVEWKWDAEEFACQTCVKAGLPKDAWQKGAKLFKFEAEVFGELPESR